MLLFFDNDRANFRNMPPQVGCVLVRSPSWHWLRVVDNTLLQTSVDTGDVVRVTVPRRMRTFVTHAPVLWERGSGITHFHIKTLYASALKANDVKAVFIDWDGTLTVCEGIPQRDQRDQRDGGLLAKYLFGGARRMGMIGRYLTTLYRARLGPYILTMNPCRDKLLTDLLCVVAPDIPRKHWQLKRPP